MHPWRCGPGMASIISDRQIQTQSAGRKRYRVFRGQSRRVKKSIMRTDAMGCLFLGLAFTFTACVSSKKTTTTSLHTVDSSTSFTSRTKADTSSKQNMLKATDLDITYYYDTSKSGYDSIYQDAVQRNNAATKDPDYASFIPHAGLVEVKVHIGTLSDSSTASSSSKSLDTAHRQQVNTAQLNQTIVEKKTVLPWWVFVGGGILLLLILLFIVYKIIK